MKKILSLMLILTLMLTFSACGEETVDPNDLIITRDPNATQETQALGENCTTPAPSTTAQKENSFAFLADGVALIPGTEFDPTQLPPCDSTYEIPSCAGQGMDLVYSYGSFEITAFRSGDKDVIYSIYLIDPNLTTPEGLRLGAPQSRVTELYGADYTTEGAGWVYTRGETSLIILFQGDTVLSIEYRSEIG